MGLSDRANSHVDEYSLGMRQRLGIAAALLHDPKLLILDEPANGLDPAGIHSLRAQLRYLADTGRTILVSSHILPEVQQLADVVGIIDKGHLVHQGSLDELLKASGGVRVRLLPNEVERARAALGRPLRARMPSPTPTDPAASPRKATAGSRSRSRPTGRPT